MFIKKFSEEDFADSIDLHISFLDNKEKHSESHYLEHAINFLRLSADLLDEIGMEEEASKLTEMLESLAENPEEDKDEEEEEDEDESEEDSDDAKDSLGHEVHESKESKKLTKSYKEHGWAFGKPKKSKKHDSHDSHDHLMVEEESSDCGYCGDKMDDHDALFCSQYCADKAWDSGLAYDCMDAGDSNDAYDSNDAKSCTGWKKAPVGSPKQRAFCKRHCGMKKKLTSKEVADDPDSCINQGLRRWKCRCH